MKGEKGRSRRREKRNEDVIGDGEERRKTYIRERKKTRIRRRELE